MDNPKQNAPHCKGINTPLQQKESHTRAYRATNNNLILNIYHIPPNLRQEHTQHTHRTHNQQHNYELLKLRQSVIFTHREITENYITSRVVTPPSEYKEVYRST